ncbi:MAG TPA: hypothetical protein VGI33_05845 [Paenibacillus sp.]|jgi:ribosomal-protein-serine acetyltransferase
MFKYEIDISSYLSILEIKDAEKSYNLISRNRDHIGEWLKFPSISQGRRILVRNMERG